MRKLSTISYWRCYRLIRIALLHGRLAKWIKWIALPTSQLILQPFRCFTYVTVHSSTLLSLLLRHKLFKSSFSNLSVTSPTSQLILQPFRLFTYVTAHSPTLPLLHLRYTVHSPTLLSLLLRHKLFKSSFSNLWVTSPTSQLIIQPFHRFTYVTAHSPTLPLLHLRHTSFSNPSFASLTSQALHLNHLASRACFTLCYFKFICYNQFCVNYYVNNWHKIGYNI